MIEQIYIYIYGWWFGTMAFYDNMIHDIKGSLGELEV